MTLLTLTAAIQELALNQKVINFSQAGTDVYALNTQTIKDYPAAFITPVGNQRVEENVTHYNLVIYYFDRLLNDSSNEMDILSVAIEQLKNLAIWIKDIAGVADVDWNYNIMPFTDTENFSDRLAGAYMTLEITAVNETVCAIG